MSAMERWTATVIGAGGNIGSHLVAHLARMLGLRRLTLVDRDVYDDGNVRSQDITRDDVGRAKATVQAARVRAIDPSLAVEAIVADVEDVPLGALRADVLFTCVDSRAARHVVNTVAWRLGTPWIDAGVHADDLLARIDVYVPGDDEPCLVCAWDDADYALLAQAPEYRCPGAAADVASAPSPAPTGAPSALGALAASLQALECGALLATDDRRGGRRVIVSVRPHRTIVTTLARRASCRCDHAVWHVETFPLPVEECTLEEALAIGRLRLGTRGPVGLRLAGHVFARRLTCVACGAARDFAPYVARRIGAADRTCRGCGGTLLPAGIDTREWLADAELTDGTATTLLSSIGLRTGDVVTASDGTHAIHFELGGIA